MLTDHKRLTAGFFRSVNSAALFKEFFEKYNVWQKLGLKVSPKNDDIYDAWVMLDHPKRDEMAEALCCMNDICREEGRDYLYPLAQAVKLPQHEDLTLPKIAMLLWLRHRKKFQLIHDCFTLEKADNLKVLIGRTKTAAPPDNINLSGFKDKLRRILRKDGEGPRMLTEVGPHPERKWVLVVPHEHFVKPDHVFKSEDEIGTRERRPVHELVVIYHYDKGLLKIKVSGRGNRKAEAVASAFATEVIRKHAGHFQVVEIVSFDPILKAGGFNFPKRPTDSFDWASPVELRFKRVSDPAFTHWIKCNNTMSGRQDVMSQLKELGFAPKEIRIESLAIQFQFPGGGRKKRRTVVLSAPNHYTLDETARDRYLEDVLERWGFINLAAKETSDAAIVVEQAA